MDNLSLMFDAKKFAAAFGAAGNRTSSARSEPQAMMWLEGAVRVTGAGLSWGHGQMNFQGGHHRFRVSSLSVAEGGAGSRYASGRVARLRKLSDFSGNYRASSAEVRIAVGSSATYLQNEHGVVIQLVATDAATACSRSVNGMQVRFGHV